MALDVNSGQLWEVREKLLQLCSQFLGGNWKRVASRDVQFYQIEGGCSNRLYYCGLRPPFDERRGQNDPIEVLVRFYGSGLTGNGNKYKALSESAEAVILYKLYLKNLGPKIFGLFSGGRLEEFLKCRNISEAENKSLEMGIIMTQKLAELHSMDEMPVSRDPFFNFGKMGDFCTKFYNEKDGLHEEEAESDRVFIDSLTSFDFKSNVEWLETVFPKIKSRVLFSHNDVHKSNIIVCEEGNYEGDVLLIDFEYCGYNYRWSDLSNYFLEMGFQWFEPGKSLSDFQFPDEDRKRVLLKNYLTQWKRLNLREWDESTDNEDNLLLETDFGSLVINLMRVLWFLSSVRKNYGLFQSWEYTFNRLALYQKQKEEFKEKYNLYCHSIQH